MRPLVGMEPLVERGMAVPHLDRQIGTVEGEALDRGDMKGRQVWLRIRRAIVQLQAVQTGPIQ